jgi:hypothetical protein
MILKFSCPKCGNDIVVQYLYKGDQAQCKYCGTITKVPRHAVEGTSKDVENYLASIPPPPPPPQPPSEAQPLLAAGVKAQAEYDHDEIPPEKLDLWGRRIIGVLLIGGGLVGFGSLSLTFTSESVVGSVISIILGVCLFAFSIIAGLALVEGSRNGRLFTKIMLLIQIPMITSPIVTYKFFSGFTCGPKVMGNSLGFEFYFSSYFYFGWFISWMDFQVGLNLYALAAFVFLRRMESRMAEYTPAPSSEQSE